MAQLDDGAFFRRPDKLVNPIALIVKHMAGNLRSRRSGAAGANCISTSYGPPRYRQLNLKCQVTSAIRMIASTRDKTLDRVTAHLPTMG
jgi:hypothetical protein